MAKNIGGRNKVTPVSQTSPSQPVKKLSLFGGPVGLCKVGLLHRPLIATTLAHPKRGAAGLQPTPLHLRSEIKKIKEGFGSIDYVIRFTIFTLQPLKSSGD
jgi:hypothetical protein